MSQPVLSVVIPTRHEAATIGAFLHRLCDAVRGVPTEIVVVDDSDDDSTPEVLQQLQVELGRDHLAVLHRPLGSVPERTLGTAVVTGIHLARGAYICVMDADGQHPPEAIPRMLAAAQQRQAEYVGGSRYMPGGSPQGLNGLSRKAISLGLALITRLSFLLTPIRNLTDPLSGFFLFHRTLVDGVALQPLGWKISLEIIVRSRARRVAEVPYTFAPRTCGDSKATFQQGLLVLHHILVLLLSLTGVQRFLTFGLVGLSGVAVNTGTLLLLQASGFDALGWPIWAATELAILWNYFMNRRITWRDRRYGRWWLYNLTALGASVLAIQFTAFLFAFGHATLWLASVAGIAGGMLVNYILMDHLVFTGLAWLSVRGSLPLVVRQRRLDNLRTNTVARA